MTAAFHERHGWRLYALSEGYVHIAADHDQASLKAVLRSASGRRTVVLTNESDQEVAFVWEDDEVAHSFCLAGPQGQALLLEGYPAAIPPRWLLFVIMRTLVLRARQPAPVARSAPLWRDLQVTLLGVGPGGDAPRPLRATALEGAEHVVVFDRIEHRVLDGLDGLREIHVVPYHYTDFTQSIDMIVDLVTELSQRAASSVAIVVEGNPEIFDLAPRLSQLTTRLVVVPARPIALQAVERAAALLGRPLIGASYAMTSGIPSRHPDLRDGLRREMLDYVIAGLGCLLLEMCSGDRELIAEWLAAAGPGHVVAVFSDMFSPAERIEIMDSPQFARAVLDEPGRWGTQLVTVAIPQAAMAAALQVP